MTKRQKVWLAAFFILLLTALAVTIDIPKGPDIKIGEYTKEVKLRLGLDLQGGTSLTYEADTKSVPAGREQDALDGLRDVIERRVNQFGVSEPSVRINEVGETWRLLVELPGITDVNAAIAEIGETPLLEFREEAPPEERSEEEKAAVRALNEEQKKKAEEVLQRALADEDFATLAKEFSQDTVSGEVGGDLDFFGRGIMHPVFEEAVFGGEVGKIIPELVETPFGYHIIKVTDRKIAEESDTGEEQVRASHILLVTQPEEIPAQILPHYVNTELNGQHLQRAEVVFDPSTAEPQVSLEFNGEGKDFFAKITEKNLNKTVAIYLDGTPISIPVVSSVITGGQAVIQGSFTVDEAKELARRLNAGALPVPITLVNQQNIGPTLGELALQKSLFAGMIGLFLVSIFMIVYYRIPGVFATLALLIYTALALAVFKLWPVTLTLAGIAGFILSVGMAVDANILIFERMKEEVKRGKSLQSGVEDGFKRAWLSIRDSNVSSLITCLILGTFSTSLIKGFAITLGIGILISMFSAITVTRTFLRLISLKRFERNPWWFGVSKKQQKMNS